MPVKRQLDDLWEPRNCGLWQLVIHSQLIQILSEFGLISPPTELPAVPLTYKTIDVDVLPSSRPQITRQKIIATRPKVG